MIEIVFQVRDFVSEKKKRKEDLLILLPFEHEAAHSDPHLTTIRDGNSVKVRAESVRLFVLNCLD